MTPADVRFAFLVLEDHPYGREMLSQLLTAGLCPDVVIEERSQVARDEKAKFLDRMRGFEIAPPIDALVAGLPTQRLVVPNHNDHASAERLSQTQPDFIVLGGTRILRPHAFAAAKLGTLNAHPGLLPEVRGSASVAWAIALDIEVGCTCHFIEPGIDTGPIVSRQTIPVRRDSTYESLCHATTTLSATLMTQALLAHVDGSLTSYPQGQGDEAKRNMPEDGVVRVRDKLRLGTYKHLVD